MSASAQVRTHFSIHHIQSAAHFARLSADTEKAYRGNCSDELFAEHRAYVTGSIFTAVSFLEATINELFADTADNPDRFIKHLDSKVVALMADIWKHEFSKKYFPILTKFEKALTLAKKEPFDPGALPYQCIWLLIKLRNALIHYEPEWNGKQASKFEKMLENKFSLNPLTGPGDAFFPKKCLSHGCAKWAVESSVKFADEFFSRMGLPSTFDHVRSRLKTD